MKPVSLPASLAATMLASPAYYLDQLALGAAGVPGHGPAIIHVAVLAVVTLIFVGLAVRRLSRPG